MTWSFREMTRGEIYANPVEAEFFTPAGVAESLIRESIQNSLDASLNKHEPVRVRFHLSGKQDALAGKVAEKYLNGLWPHLQVIEGQREKCPQPDSPMYFLTIEDFGTRGLSGPVDKEPNVETNSDESEDFSFFWRNVGRSGKEENKLGSWGLGKTVFPAASRANAFFGLTVRDEDNQAFLMGQSVLKIHHLNGAKYCPYGFYCKPGDDGFQFPIDDQERLQQFQRDFKLERGNQTGLSVVVPFPDIKDIKLQPMVRLAILHYFYPILHGKLVMEISGDELDLSIDAESIDEIAKSIDWKGTDYSADQLNRLFDFTRKSIEFNEDELLELPSPGKGAPDWKKVFSEEAVVGMKQQFEERKMLAVRVPLDVYPNDEKQRSTYFDLYLEQDSKLDGAEDHYIRQGITISNISMLREKGYRGLVVVTDQALSILLRDSENPAHTEWQERATKLKQRYEKNGPSTVRFVRNALRNIVAKLLFVPEGRDEDLLKDLFFVPDELTPPEESSKPKRKKKKAPEEPEPDTPPIPPIPPAKPKNFKLDKIPGGFRISRDDEETPPPGTIDVKVAYRTRRNDALNKYSFHDFRLDKAPISIEAFGAPSYAKDNTIEIVPENSTFLVEVTGFDPNRDLEIQAKVKKVEVIDAEEV